MKPAVLGFALVCLVITNNSPSWAEEGTSRQPSSDKLDSEYVTPPWQQVSKSAVDVAADRPLTLYQEDSSSPDDKREVCKTPCRVMLDNSKGYFFEGAGVRDSNSFNLPVDATHTQIRVRTYDRRKIGLPLLLMGPVAIGLGLALPLALGFTGKIGDWETVITLIVAGPIGGGGGIAMIAFGSYYLAKPALHVDMKGQSVAQNLSIPLGRRVSLRPGGLVF